MADNWQIRASTFYLLAFVITLILIPLPGGLQFVMPFVSIPIFLYFKNRGHIKDFKFIDFILIFVYTILGISSLLYFQVLSISSVPWWKIIIIGIAADVIATVLASVPIVGDALSGLINIFMAIMVVNGIEGAFIAMTIMMISFIPGPSLGANTIMLIIFKIVSDLVIK